MTPHSAMLDGRAAMSCPTSPLSSSRALNEANLFIDILIDFQAMLEVIEVDDTPRIKA